MDSGTAKLFLQACSEQSKQVPLKSSPKIKARPSKPKKASELQTGRGSRGRAGCAEIQALAANAQVDMKTPFSPTSLCGVQEFEEREA